MPNLSIKDVPEAWAQALRERAARNHRSLQGELMALIQRVVEPGSLPPDASTRPLDKPTSRLENGRSKLPQNSVPIRMTPSFVANCPVAWTSFAKSETRDESAR